MKTPSPEKNVRRYLKNGLPNGKPINPYGYRQAWHRAGQQLRGRGTMNDY